jgi:hypothetical protein
MTTEKEFPMFHKFSHARIFIVGAFVVSCSPNATVSSSIDDKAAGGDHGLPNPSGAAGTGGMNVDASTGGSTADAKVELPDAHSSSAPDAMPMNKDGATAEPPFFPMGAYLCCTQGGNVDTIIADLTTLAGAGFNSASFEFGFDKTGKFDKVLATAARLGMKVIVENSVDVTGEAGTVTRYKNQPGIFAWNIGDDLHRKYTAAQVKLMHDAVKRADAMHPDLGIVYNPKLWTDFASADLLGIYKYPVADIKDNGGSAAGQGALFTVDDWLSAGRKLNKPLIGIPQGYAWPNDRFPSPPELRNMAFQMVANNIQGLIWYAFGRSGAFLGPHRSAEWLMAQQIAKDILSLVPDMYAGTFSRLGDATQTIRVAQWVLPNETLVVVVNTGAAAMVSTPLQTGARQTVRAGLANASTQLEVKNGVLDGSIAALGVEVVRIR